MIQLIVCLTFFGLSSLWVLIRVGIFISERSDFLDLPPDLYVISTWMLRALLIIIAGATAFLAIPGLLFALCMGDAFSGQTSYWAYIVLFSLELYALAAVIMNFPFFPIRLHQKLFYRIHLILLPCLIILPHLVYFAFLAAAGFVYFLLWRLCLMDRLKNWPI